VLGRFIGELVKLGLCLSDVLKNKKHILKNKMSFKFFSMIGLLLWFY